MPTLALLYDAFRIVVLPQTNTPLSYTERTRQLLQGPALRSFTLRQLALQET